MNEHFRAGFEKEAGVKQKIKALAKRIYTRSPKENVDQVKRVATGRFKRKIEKELSDVASQIGGKPTKVKL